LIDKVTSSVLFFDMGEQHEAWFATPLAGWDAGRIATWLKENTSFAQIEILGMDRDSAGPYQAQYRRHLFACYRS
jgi:hypothetical protein